MYSSKNVVYRIVIPTIPLSAVIPIYQSELYNFLDTPPKKLANYICQSLFMSFVLVLGAPVLVRILVVSRITVSLLASLPITGTKFCISMCL